eukprot:COSAG01_NODE_5260_length_4377_cov_13.545115_5_plen_86_part_00
MGEGKRGMLPAGHQAIPRRRAHHSNHPVSLRCCGRSSSAQLASAAASSAQLAPHRAFPPGQPPQQILGAVRVGLCYLRGGQCAVS